MTGPHIAALDLIHLLGTSIPILHRVHIAASSMCARELTSLLQAVEQDQTWETLTGLLNFPRISLAAPARAGKATKPSSTQQCRLNCLAAVMDRLGELTAHIQGQAMTDGAQNEPKVWLRRQGRPRPRPRPQNALLRPSGSAWRKGQRDGPSDYLPRTGSVIRPTRPC